MNDSTISVGILYRFLDERWTRFFADIAYLLEGFAICQNVPLSIHKDDQPQLSRPRVVNHDTRGKSRKRDEGWLFIFDR